MMVDGRGKKKIYSYLVVQDNKGYLSVKRKRLHRFPLHQKILLKFIKILEYSG